MLICQDQKKIPPGLSGKEIL